ncbi:thiamine-phosphate synthase family protein [Metallosphaera javensis (ex Sakai et al. 2022)]|uniref:thiamine-phosphate synthase family protein n=1 Tax=Metallosphaera javensis (ex Sakai et al. 2022) TaxID=2775498 RepID=UPI00258FED72|nr:MAG: bifunctional thiamine biosynthesis protein ThiDN [Metallosphaera javensis (ex Sakai et al. 2022)]
MDDERKLVLQELEKAVKEFVSQERSYLLIPEVRTNIGYAVRNAKDSNDVAAIPGRITTAFQRAIYCLPPAFGASDHVARVILTAMKYDPDIRSAINLAYYPQFLRLNPYLFDRSQEPQAQKPVEGRTMNFMIEKAVREVGRVPELIVDKGDFGKEPGLFILGRNPSEVVSRAIHLLSLL